MLKDFRPISVINTAAKIFTKVLANRLEPTLPSIISNKQTAFIKGRSMMESFLGAREFLCYVSKNKLLTVLYKVDFEKAFASVDWCFLTNLQIEKGFPPRWISAVLNTLQTSSSAVCVKGSLISYFGHKRGLRQGDPLSPMLFTLVSDSLNAFIINTVHLMHPPIFMAPQPIQFADDTIIIAEAHATTLKTISTILQTYEKLTGLRINSNKSSFIPIAIPQSLIQAVSNILSCQPSTLPISYLGLPLTIKRPNRLQFQPLLSAVEDKLACWKANYSLLEAGSLS